ncbi:hypothetical protein, partial [Actinocorallia lasiicapitis]
ARPTPGAPADPVPPPAVSGGRKIRSLAVVTCLAPGSSGIRQTICGGKDTDWTQTPAGNGFTLKNEATGQCLSRGDAKGGGRFTLTTSACGGPYQTWTLDGGHFGDPEGNLLFADPVGVLPLFLTKPSLLSIIGQLWTLI